jgi:sulfatase maturation enzyme AslB (radical SAM superfamily)
MLVYQIPLIGKNKSVMAVPSRGYYSFNTTSILKNNNIYSTVLTPGIEEVEFTRQRNAYFTKKRKDFIRLNSDTCTKLFWLITADCKGRCSYCYAAHAREETTIPQIEGDKYLSYEGLLDACKKYKIDIENLTDIQVLGGEPLLYLDEIIKLATNHPNLIVGVSTGLMVDDATIEKTMLTLCKLDNVSFSISIDPNYPDYARVYEGKQFYSESLKRLVLIDSATSRWGIRATISDERQNISQLEQDIRNHIKDQKSFLTFTVDLLMGEAAETQTSALENLYRWAKLKIDELLISERPQLKDPEVFENSLPYPVKHFFSLFRNFGLSVVQQNGCCDVVIQRLAIDYKGTLNYCAESPMTKYADDWRYSGCTEDVVNRRIYTSEHCEQCDIFQYCGGVCFFNFEYYGVNKQQCGWWEQCAILAMYALFNYKEKYLTLTEEDLK